MEVEEKEEAEEKAVILSKRKRKLLSRLSVAQLKQLVKRPDVVEVGMFQQPRQINSPRA